MADNDSNLRAIRNVVRRTHHNWDVHPAFKQRGQSLGQFFAMLGAVLRADDVRYSTSSLGDEDALWIGLTDAHIVTGEASTTRMQIAVRPLKLAKLEVVSAPWTPDGLTAPEPLRVVIVLEDGANYPLPGDDISLEREEGKLEEFLPQLVKKVVS
ncbi:hypothetical protein ACFJGV_15280 [Cnuibacter sp. UC19_7]|uniref:hypothetical protein n=1 Tax=Cnuibacter sp. UC19_7 TaxID=3350166 RepID=UPI003670BF7E